MRNKYVLVDNETRWKIVQLTTEQSIPICKVARMFNLNYYTTRSIVQNFKLQGKVNRESKWTNQTDDVVERR